MPPVLLFRETFEGEVGTVNAEDRTPVTGPGGAPEYLGDANRFLVFADGYGQEFNAQSASVLRYPYVVPPGTNFRTVIDIFREGADHVGGGADIYCYTPATPIATWDFTDCLRGEVQRQAFGGVSLAIRWIKAVGSPAPPTLQLAFGADIAHAAGTTKRYEFEYDETAMKVRIYRSDAGTGLNPVLLSEGTLPDEMIAHLAADRRVGWTCSYATLGLVGFRLSQFEVYDMGAAEVIEGPPCKCLLQVFDDDLVTVLWEVGTDPTHANPYLVEPENYGEQQIDVATGSATLASVSVTVIDPAQTAGDQDSGWLTERLALFGLANIGGHRCRLIRFVPDGILGYQVLADGPASQPRLNPDYASYSWEIRDTRETERKVRCFDLLGISAPVIVGATPAGPDEPGTDYDIDWGVETNP